ncbi:ribonuclease [Cephaloticoccus primus]|uniref:Ribonuclease n=1 Tax=Cephaloticoccus primus TaxID=1548207 RepID=A0A139SRD1_9BACT|nr:ribonuclease [Cephaloticoccus primus]
MLSTFKKEKESYRELIINAEPLERRVALLVDGRLEKFEIERDSDTRMVGGVYKGRIKNLDPGLKAAFVDIGYTKNAFLHYWDMLPAAADSSVEVVRVNKKKTAPARPAEPTVKDIPRLYPPGSEIVIQVTKGPIGTKGPRTTTNIALPGRYLILMPFSDGCGISRKIEEPAERKRLKRMLNELTIPEGMGVIVRTAGEGKKTRYFVRDLHLLLKQWEKITARTQTERAPACLYQEPDLVERTVRDFLTEEVDRVLIDDKTEFERTQDLVGQISKRSRSRIALYEDTIPIFERFNIERQIEQTFQRKVPLPSGGEIIIDETEALISIDVNTGSHKNSSNDERNTIYAVNLEAAVEAARQIRLRNLGGLIIIDFIDMKERRHRNAIYEKMVSGMALDRAKSHILPISTLGILQMTRQRQQESLSSNLYTVCPYCRGRGIVKSATTLSVELQRKLSSVIRRLTARDAKSQHSLRVLVHPSILERIRSEDADLLIRMETLYGVKLAFRADPNYHVENYKILNATTGEEYR